MKQASVLEVWRLILPVRGRIGLTTSEVDIEVADSCRLTLRLEGNIRRNRGGLELRIQTIRHRNPVRLAVAPLRPFGAAGRHQVQA
jgi:hypothetical protein